MTFTEYMRLADLLQADHNLILMLPRFGIPLGFGDKSVAEVCRRYDVPVDFFILICNVYSFEAYCPDERSLQSTNMRLLIPYLKASHRYYLSERLVHINQHLMSLAATVDEKYSALLVRFFDDYRSEIADHFNYEEKVVFPYLTLLEQAKVDEPLMLSPFEDKHGDIEDKLNDLTQIIFKYLPGDVEHTDSIDLIFDIFQIATDLSRHALIEEKILLPYIRHLETSLHR